jgi:acyl-CoA thioester hydrolase
MNSQTLEPKKTKEPAIDLEQEIIKFKHVTYGRAKFDEVDSAGVVHNIRYLFWLERARTDYFGAIGIKLNPKTFISEYPIMVVHTEIDYFNTAHFNDDYKILTRASKIGKSSLTFENIVLKSDNTLLVSAKAIFVHLDHKIMKPTRISDDLRTMLSNFEGNHLLFTE